MPHVAGGPNPRCLLLTTVCIWCHLAGDTTVCPLRRGAGLGGAAVGQAVSPGTAPWWDLPGGCVHAPQPLF